MPYLIIYIIASFLAGTGISSFFGKYKDEQYYFWRTYEKYKRGDVDLTTVIFSAIVNTGLGLIIVTIFFGDFLFKKLVLDK